ncbi:YbaB/EbfC family DNA-binding protein [Epidermidibacterium keratini]|uniref:YbaB/EbfC family DNA-binding protein n=1 Tax=Epidermidibacterium keratini TaxID=1891644 RepID=A0A7L4YPZ3_9ACTN|nr:YbaB/EbfC family nucleoid-associated protein [Epidermidibacterium keratini]QHC00869.1 YbaB/EbfC family DNA-binding protein [Epidermidibacterium keratini]
MTVGGDPQINALREMASNLRAQFDNMVERGPDLARQAREVTGAATSPDGLITVEVDARGQLTQLEIDPRIYRRPDSQELADTIVETTRAAAQDAQDKVVEVFEPIVGKDQMRSALTADPDKIVDDVNTHMGEIGRQYE